MRQTRLSIGCQDWQSMTEKIGATAAAVYLYLRTMMRGMQAAEITITLSELAQAVKLPSDATESALRAICVEHMGRVDNMDGTITLRDQREAAAQADMLRKRAARLLSRKAGQSGRADSPRGQSGVLTATSDDLSKKQYETDFFMIYSGPSEKKEKTPHTPKKEKSLTESPRARKASSARQQSTASRVDEIDLPSDQLEAEYIDVCGPWPPSLRKAVRAEKDDVREAFYLYIRQREAEDNRTWTSDQVRIALLAVKRISEERRAESILAASMGKWKTIRDAGSGVYFEKETGRVVSLVRSTVEPARNRSAVMREAEDMAIQLARNMRKD